ncbi:hypothetical protein AURDEDRAFT_76478 [Auricularia subglabra TFB-10046 SS5]|uniref:Uncharacterized protein n=1 Tax=Auricularia subglabra (strain TFB-10046 / SS5) TaxID=717982 RepID=J0WQD5_AURST|nr:hypothetical protein AURDEDRAFT_76478 [Auricularia subglabra TFB-10046 SS5]
MNDPSYYLGRSIIYNRATAVHTDARDKKMGWNVIITEGEYVRGVFRALGYDIQYPPGTLVIIRGAAVPHSADFDGGFRVCMAHFSHESVLNGVGMGPLPMMTAAEVSRSLLEYDLAHMHTRRRKVSQPIPPSR